MRDLRTLDIEARRALALEAKALTEAGRTPAEVRATLGVRVGTYRRWAKMYGFRQGDLRPDAPRAGARVSTPAGPGGYCRSGQHYLDLPVPEDDKRRVSGADHPSWRGGAAAARAGYQALRDERRDAFMTKVAFMADEDVLAEVRALADAGRLTEVDRWLRAWQAAQRRERLIGALEKAVQGFAEVDRPIGASGQPMKTLKEIQAMSDEDLIAFVERQIAPPQRTDERAVPEALLRGLAEGGVKEK